MPMIFRILASLVAVFTVASATDAQAQKAAALKTDCASDIQKYCASVLPGGDRVVACLVAYEDKITARCRMTAYLASGNLGARMKEMQRVAKTCSSDILQYCAKVPAGGGRIYDCLEQHKATLTDECRKNAPTFEKILKN